MKKLYLIRHAKSSWSDLSLSDFDRPLNKRGLSNAPFMGELLKAKSILPDIVLSSPAKRTKETAEMIVEKIGFSNQINFDNNLYEADYMTLHNIISKINNQHNIAFLFAHNPGLNMLAMHYINFEENIPTTGIVEIDFDVDKWSQIEQKNARFVSFEYPKLRYPKND